MKLKKIHMYPFTVTFDLLDAGKALHHPNYLIVLERARAAALTLAGLSDMELWKLGYGITVAHVELQYLKPIRLGENVTILTELLDVGSATLEVRQSIVLLENDHKNSFVQSFSRTKDNLIHDAKLRLCCVDLETLRPRRFPDQLKQVMAI